MRPSSYRELKKPLNGVLERGADCDSNAGRCLVFRRGSGSTKEDINTTVGNGVIMMKVDTDRQYVYLVGIRVRSRFSFDLC